MDWGALAAVQGGVIGRSQLRDLGAYDQEITRLVDRGQLRRLVDGVFLARGAPLTRQARVWAAVLTTGGVIGFDTAGYLWGQAPEAPALVHVCVDHDIRSHAPAWIRTHRVVLPAWARTTRGDLPITTSSWTVLDLVGAAAREGDASRLLDRGLQQGWLRPDDIQRRLAACPNRPGNPRLRRLGLQLQDGAASRSERVLHSILRGGRVTGWKANYRIPLVDGAAIVADVAFPRRRLVIEVDGWAYHSDVDRFRRDRHRQNTLVALGWTVLRFTWADLTERPGYVLAAIRDQGAYMHTG